MKQRFIFMATLWLVFICLVVPYKCCCCDQKWKQFSLCVSIVAQFFFLIWAAAEVISPLLSIFFFNFPSCLSHCLNTCTSTVSIFGYHNNLQFILLSVPESLCCVNRAGGVGRCFILQRDLCRHWKAPPWTLEKFWTFVFFQLCKRKYNQLAITHLNNFSPPFSQRMKSS